MYYGVLIVVASALIWMGAWLTKRIEWILPYTGAVGVVLIIIAVAMELRNRGDAPVETALTGDWQSTKPKMYVAESATVDKEDVGTKL
jgi:hypothetical protein